MAEKGYIHFLKAGYGDAFILHCRKGNDTGVIVVDGGQGTTSKINHFISEVVKIERLDLMVLTHPDDDHLIGIKKYVERHLNATDFPVKEFWANCASNVEIKISSDASSRSAKRLSEILDELAREHKTDWKNEVCVEMDFHYPFADILVISPSLPVLKEFVERYRERIGYYDKQEGINASKSADGDYEIPMCDLALRDKRNFDLNDYSDASNASSIAFILRCDDFSILMLGDSFPSSIIKGLESKGYSKTNPLKVDYVKVAHHGSKSNISNDLLDMIDCRNFIISTNGQRYNHPDREAIANILCHPLRDYSKEIKLYCNYPVDTLETPNPHIFNTELDKNLNFQVITSINENELRIKID